MFIVKKQKEKEDIEQLIDASIDSVSIPQEPEDYSKEFPNFLHPKEEEEEEHQEEEEEDLPYLFNEEEEEEESNDNNQYERQDNVASFDDNDHNENEN